MKVGLYLDKNDLDPWKEIEVSSYVPVIYWPLGRPMTLFTGDQSPSNTGPNMVTLEFERLVNAVTGEHGYVLKT